MDPLANAGPYQRIVKTPVKSFTLTEAQFDRVRAERPNLVLIEGENAVVGRPYRDWLEVHYGFPDVEAFRERFEPMFDQVVDASSKEEAPRGILLSFRDRPNRMVADTVFWPLALEQDRQWVEMNLVSVPEQPEPETKVGGYELREPDYDAVAEIEAEVAGQPRLTPAGYESMVKDSKLLRVLGGESQTAAGYLSLRTEPGGWGVIEALGLRGDASESRADLVRWCVAWLRNNGGRRVRIRVGIDENLALKTLRELGFTPGETGLDYTRTIDKAEALAKIAERQAHGTVIKFGDWR